MGENLLAQHVKLGHRLYRKGDLGRAGDPVYGHPAAHVQGKPVIANPLAVLQLDLRAAGSMRRALASMNCPPWPVTSGAMSTMSSAAR